MDLTGSLVPEIVGSGLSPSFEEEILVLQSIFPDILLVENTSLDYNREFPVRITGFISPSDTSRLSVQYVKVKVVIQVPAQYPEDGRRLSISVEQPRGLTEANLARLRETLEEILDQYENQQLYYLIQTAIELITKMNEPQGLCFICLCDVAAPHFFTPPTTDRKRSSNHVDPSGSAQQQQSTTCSGLRGADLLSVLSLSSVPVSVRIPSELQPDSTSSSLELSSLDRVPLDPVPCDSSVPLLAREPDDYVGPIMAYDESQCNCSQANLDTTMGPNKSYDRSDSELVKSMESSESGNRVHSSNVNHRCVAESDTSCTRINCLTAATCSSSAVSAVSTEGAFSSGKYGETTSLPQRTDDTVLHHSSLHTQRTDRGTGQWESDTAAHYTVIQSQNQSKPVSSCKQDNLSDHVNSGDLEEVNSEPICIRTSCYHHFHTSCLRCYAANQWEEYKQWRPNPALPRIAQVTKVFSVLCPVCRQEIVSDCMGFQLDDSSHMTCWKEMSGRRSYEPDESIIEWQRQMRDRIAHQTRLVSSKSATNSYHMT